MHLSAITKIELLGYKVERNDEAILRSFISGTILLPVADDVIERAIWVCKQGSIKTPDAIIAATALVYNLSFVSRNTKDFKHIKGLQIMNPWILT